MGGRPATGGTSLRSTRRARTSRFRSDAFLATGVLLGQAAPELDEDVSVVRMPVAEALSLARAGGFREGQTALAILLAAPYLDS